MVLAASTNGTANTATAPGVVPRERVKAVLRRALQLAVRVLFQFELSDRQAELLARGSSLAEVIKRLQRRIESGALRGSSAVARDREFQRYLAVEEVIIELEHPLAFESLVSDFILRAVSEREEYLRQKQAENNVYDRVRHDVDQFALTQMEFRAFLARCDHLRDELQGKLAQNLKDTMVLSRARSELDRLFARYMEMAVKIVERASENKLSQAR